MSENNKFEYNYSAKEQTEIKKIREKYITPAETEDKMARLRQLDASVTQKASVVSLVFGVVGALILGFGMSLCMTDLGEALGNMAMAMGIITGTVGCIIASLAYPMYNLVINRERKKIAPEIIRLTDELLK